MEIFFSPDEEEIFKEKFSFLLAKYAVFHLGADNPENIWPYWLQLSAEFIKKFGLAIVFTGTEKDVKINSALANLKKDEIFFLAGQTTIREATWIISRAQYYVGGDTGNTHMAIDSTVTTTPKSTAFFNGMLAELKRQCIVRAWQTFIALSQKRLATPAIHIIMFIMNALILINQPVWPRFYQTKSLIL